MSETPTPRTDACSFFPDQAINIAAECVYADFARALERELTAEGAALQTAQEQIARLEGRACLLCGADKPCMTEADLAPNDPGVPCTFDPSPIDAARRFFDERNAERAARERAEAERDALAEALRRAHTLFEEALPKFNWGASALDGKAIALLNDVPLEVARALAAKLRAMADAPSGWQPIETAPRDGTCVLQHYLGEGCAGY